MPAPGMLGMGLLATPMVGTLPVLLPPPPPLPPPPLALTPEEEKRSRMTASERYAAATGVSVAASPTSATALASTTPVGPQLPPPQFAERKKDKKVKIVFAATRTRYRGVRGAERMGSGRGGEGEAATKEERPT